MRPKSRHTVQVHGSGYVLVPAIGEINGLRFNYSYAMIPGEKRKFGKCDMEIEGRKAEPPADKRGNIAAKRIFLRPMER